MSVPALLRPWAGRDPGRARPGAGLNPANIRGVGPAVDAGGLSPNTWERLERLSAAWEQAKPGIVSARPLVTEPEPGAVSNPTRRSRTPLTPEEVDAIRTARTNGESVLSIAKRFGVHRVTVWEQTKNS